MAEPDPDLNPSRPSLFGDDEPTTQGAVSTIGAFEVGRSGETIFFRPADAQGKSLAVTGLRSTDDIQVIRLAGSPAGPTATLSLGNRVSAPVALRPLPPLTSVVMTAALPTPGTYELSFSYAFNELPPTGRACTQTMIRLFDGENLIGTVTLDQSKYPNAATDRLVPGLGIFKSLGSFAIPSGNLKIWISGEEGEGPVLSGMVRIVPEGTTTEDQVGYIDSWPSPRYWFNGALAGRTTVEQFGTWTENWADPGGVFRGFAYAMPTGNRATAFPTAEDVQAALQALPNMPSGSVEVTAPSNQSLRVHFTGVLSNQSMPTLVPSDPALAIVHDDTGGSSVGGQVSVATINGVPHSLKAASFGPGRSVVAFHLVQDAPAVQYVRCGEAYFYPTGYPNFRFDGGFGPRVAMPTTSGTVATCRFEGLAGPAEFEVALTWPVGDAKADRLDCVVRDDRGEVLARLAGIDQSQPPAEILRDGVGWMIVGRLRLEEAINRITISLDNAGTPGRHCLIDAIRLTRISPAQGVRINPGDEVLFSAPAGFVETAGGPLPAARSLRVRPRPDRRFPPLPDRPRKMKLGINCDAPAYYLNDSYHSNYAIMMDGPVGLETGPDGYPTKLAADPYGNRGRSRVILSMPASDGGGAGSGSPNCTAGDWVVQWSSDSGTECELVGHGETTVVVEDLTRRVTGAINRRFFRVTHQASVSPSLWFQLWSDTRLPDGTFACHLRDLAIYPPDIDPDRPGRWRQSFLDKLAGLQCLRLMDLFGTNNLNLVSYDHFPSRKQFPLGYRSRTIVVPIATIGPPEPDPYCDWIGGPVVRVTTAVPHGLVTGFIVSLRSTDGSSLGQVLSNAIDPQTGLATTTTRDPLDPTDNLNGSVLRGSCHVIDETTFQLGLERWSGPFARMTNTLTPANGIVYGEIAPGATMDPADAADLCAEVGLEPWINIPWLADDDCVARLARTFAERTPPGVPVHVEYANEPWNYLFGGFHYADRMDRLVGGSTRSSIPFYTRRMGQVHRLFRDAWFAAGRDPGEVRRVCGAQQAFAGGTTALMLDLAITQGTPFEELTVASYFGNEPLHGPSDDLLTREQLLDLLAVGVDLGVTAAQMATHTAAVAAAAAAHPDQDWLGRVELVNYEGGPETLTTSTMTANLSLRNHGVHRDPDFLEIMLNWLDKLDASGVRLFNIFTMYGTRPIYQWGVYEGFQMQPGTGDPLLDSANRDDFENLLAVKSQTAGALRQWEALRAGMPMPSPWVDRSRLGAYGRAKSAWAA